MAIHRVLVFAFFFTLLLTAQAVEKDDWDFPLGPLGGRCYLQLGEGAVRISELDAQAPGAQAGLKVNDYLIGAFGQPFEKAIDDTWNFFTGPLKGLGEAIEKAQRRDGNLVLTVLRSEVGIVEITIPLGANGGLGPSFPLGSTAFVENYEKACQAIHENVINETWRGVTGYKYPYLWCGIALLSHPNWNDTTGEKPYRLSINKVRDVCLSNLANAQYAPVESLLLDGSANPNFVNQFAGHENWALNVALLFMAEYLHKTKESEYYDEFQTYVEKISNRVQWWSGHTGRRPPAGGAHAGVHSDYNNCGFNICTSHSYSALAMASRVTDTDGNPVIDLTVRPRDGRHFGYAIGETKPANALPSLPDGWDPEVDPSIAEKMDWQWQQLTESANPSYGAIHYWHGLTSPTFGREAFARNAGAVFGYHTALGNTPVPAADQPMLDLITDYLVRFNREHQYAHTHTITSIMFNHLAMTYWTTAQRRHLLDNWKFYWNLAWQPDGPPAYFTTLFENDNDSHYLLGELFTALPYGVASGGLSLVPGWEPQELIIDFSRTPHLWDVPEYRTLTTSIGSITFDLSLVDSNGAPVIPDAVTWNILEGDPTSISNSSPNSLTTSFTFDKDERYTIQLIARSGTQTVSETLQIQVHTRTAPEGYKLGSALYHGHADVSGGETILSISGDGEWIKPIYQLDLPPISENMVNEVNGYLIPKETGNYRFYIASRNDSQFYLDTNNDGDLEQIAICTTEPDDYDWTDAPEQKSTLIPLVADQPYFFELLHKTDRFEPGPVAVGWTTPSDSEIKIIDSSVLAQPITSSPVNILNQPSDHTLEVGGFANLFFRTNYDGLALYQWYRNGIPVGVPETSFPLILWPAHNGSAGEYDCVVTIGDTVLTSETATVTVADGNEVIEGSLRLDFFTETTGGEVSDLFDDKGFPWLIDGTDTISSFAYQTAVQSSNHLGHRVTGWLVPSESANYRLIAVGDDQLEVYFSPTEYAAHKELVISTTRTGGHLSWSHGGAEESEYVPLIAGERYYIELLHKENISRSHFGVTWQKEGEALPANGANEIPSANLQHLRGGHHGDPGPVPPYYRDELYISSYLDEATYQDPEKGGRYGDASGDGLANVFSYLFDLGDPQQSSFPKLQLAPQPQPGLPYLSKATSDGFTFSYVCPRNDHTFTITPLVSRNLSEWKRVDDLEAAQSSTMITTENINDDYKILTHHFPPSPGPLFFRVSTQESNPQER